MPKGGSRPRPLALPAGPASGGRKRDADYQPAARSPAPVCGGAWGTATGTAADPKLNFPGNSTTNPYASSATTGKTLNTAALVATAQAAGGSQPHTNLQPVLALNYIICTEGTYPSQS
ncbi:hypothetical protein [Hymenobacter sp. BRD67]|uniref:hypothetical protein n=1 Tax=Hymenobacter sp. BRD67 TaxID=2675877 RepID=UPI0015640DBF|nr:hypothetical protein [Hymenobacter sp. BRD67]QKG53174.1 hypothetical protein GKZ67_11940 [Hymenobacter sp. BRD67]